MASLNKVMLIGNLVQDPEVRRTSTGVAVSTLRVAVNESYQSKSGERVERAVFLDVDVWDRQAEICQQYLSKGSPVFIEGRLQLDTWEDRETKEKRSRLKVRAERVQFLSSRREGGSRDGDRRDAASASEPSSFKEPLSQSDVDDDVPF
ncbi:MAG TPA: single-stranded DNA-binding protein [Kiritimatiellia bacterium]|jgi:single-strand DNA-binding protein|nr:single-stranded DNA-binding protein [Lentisphaerota bacterium]HRV31303.1 single-stranded DNA-binding protein [Kiritimatiellia bacterium]